MLFSVQWLCSFELLRLIKSLEHCCFSPCSSEAEWDSFSAATSTMLWPEYNLLRRITADPSQRKFLDRQWLGDILLPGMVVVVEDLHYISLGSINHTGALLWPLRTHVHEGRTFFSLQTAEAILHEVKTRWTPWLWYVIQDLDDVTAVPARFLSPAHLDFILSHVDVFSPPAVEPAADEGPRGLCIEATGEPTNVLQQAARMGWKGLNKDSLTKICKECQT